MITMKDIALHTGVSIATVSAVLRNKDVELCIKRETAANIRKAAKELGYRRSDAALQMQSGKSKNMIQFLPENSGDYFAIAAIKTSSVAVEQGYSVKDIFHGNDDKEFEDLVFQTLGQWPVGYLTWSSGNKFNILYKLASKYNIPVITLDFDEKLATASILSDDTLGMRQAVEYLASIGHRKIGHATDPLTLKYASMRYDGYKKALDEFGLDLNEEWCFHGNSHDKHKELVKYVERIAAMRDRPTAIVCGSDYIAVRLMMICPSTGLLIPRDISIIGYGGLPIAEQCAPHLTTIVQPFGEFGKIAIEILLKTIEKQPHDRHCLLPTKLRMAGTARKLLPS